MDAIQQAVFQSLSTIVVALIGIATKALMDYLKSKNLAEKIHSKREIILIVVEAVEQLWGAGSGPEKLKAARKFAITELQENGIKISSTELDLFIEAAVKEMKKNSGLVAEEIASVEVDVEEEL